MPKPTTTIPIQDWNIIVKKIYEQQCVPFLGAGVNLKCGDEGSLPLGAEVALRLLERMIRRQEEISDATYRINWKNLKQYREDARAALAKLSMTTADQLPLNEAALENLLKSVLQILPDEQAKLAHIIVDESLDQYQDLTRVALQDLARVSLRYRRNKNLPDFVDELKEIIPDTKQNTPRLLRILANMPFRLIVTTNYDRLMERALELFSETALTDPNELTIKVKTDGSALSQFISESVSDAMFESLAQFDSADPAPAIPAPVWIAELNALIQQTRLYLLGDAKFIQKGLTDEAWNELDKRPESVERVKQNRMLVETCYPAALKVHDKTYEAIVQPISGFKGTEENRIRKTLSAHQGLVLYKLHGT